MTTKSNNKSTFVSIRPLARLTGISVRDLVVTVGPLLLLTIIVICVAYWFIRPAPPDTITISCGPAGSSFRLAAEKYRKILARNGVKLQILPSEGSLDNLKKLSDPNSRVDVAFVQGGISSGVNLDKLVSLGSVFRLPLMLFYRAPEPVQFLSGLAQKRFAIGPEGSGTRALALVLLKANGIEPGGKTPLVDWSGEEAANALIEGKIDAAFLMGDSATPPIMRRLLWSPGIRLLDFSQADAYIRRYPYLSKLILPRGAFDFGKNVPSQDIQLIGPTVELVARENLHPALSDLLIDAAREVHSRATILQHAGEFPAPLEHEFRLSDDARRFYSSGKSFIYRNLPFWLANLVDRILVVLVPVFVLLIPGIKLAPTVYNWRVRSRIYRWYGLLINIERNLLIQTDSEKRRELFGKLDEIEGEVNKMKMPLSYADQIFVLRDHINFVRNRYHP